ncbi:MAG: SUF system NifU family Fe-S cluster assembly protein [Thermoleophilia bacterium]|nr:SUF system NifU family Fe-S cluster assembly protein [Thermoleophilia bacterium]
MGSIDVLYQEIILDHFRAPRGEGNLRAPTATVDSNNPLCGDEVHLEVRVEEGKIAELAHTGQGCSISRSATSMLAEEAVGLEVDEALDRIEYFRLMLHGDAEPDEDRLGDAIALEGVAKFPARVKCALLGWLALKEALTADPAEGGSNGHR